MTYGRQNVAYWLAMPKSIAWESADFGWPRLQAAFFRAKR